MSLFDDDFYSTKMKRGLRGRNMPGAARNRGFGNRFETGAVGMERLREWLASGTLRVAVVSSLVSALVVALVFVLATGGRPAEPQARPALAGGQQLVETSERLVSASAKIRPAVVSIINITKETPDDGNALYRAGNDYPYDIPDNANLGSGVIIESKKGKSYIVTNAHVVADAVKVEVVLIDGSKKEATIVGSDTISDLAVLSIDSQGVETVAEIGQSDKLRVGEIVIAVGNPLGFADSVTNGIISSLHRIVPVSLGQDGHYDWEQEVIQTTAPINQGNSGGVLADLNGRVIGINSMKIADTGVEGIGFAIPIDAVMPVAKQLMEYGRVLRPYMGIYSMDLAVFLNESGRAGGNGEDDIDGQNEDIVDLNIPEGITGGVLVLEAVGPAGHAGLRLNDIITELDGQPIRGTKDLRKFLYNEKKIGDTLTVTFYRDGKKEKLKLILTEKDGEQ